MIAMSTKQQKAMKVAAAVSEYLPKVRIAISQNEELQNLKKIYRKAKKEENTELQSNSYRQIQLMQRTIRKKTATQLSIRHEVAPEFIIKIIGHE